MTNPAETRCDPQMDDWQLRKICAYAVSRCFAGSNSRKFADRSESRGRPLRSISAGEPGRSEICAGISPHLSATSDEAWTFWKPPVRSTQRRAPEPLAPEELRVAEEPADHDIARHALAKHGGHFRPRRNPQNEE